LLTIEHMAIFVVKSIHLQINDQVMDLTIKCLPASPYGVMGSLVANSVSRLKPGNDSRGVGTRAGVGWADIARQLGVSAGVVTLRLGIIHSGLST